VITPAAGHR